MSEREPHRRTMFPIPTNNPGLVRKGPDVPQVELEGLEGIGFFIPQGCKGKKIIGVVESKPAVNGNGYVPVKGEFIIPQEKLPITRVFRTRFGGGRVGGGGTSEKSLRKAKEQAKKRKRKFNK